MVAPRQGRQQQPQTQDQKQKEVAEVVNSSSNLGGGTASDPSSTTDGSQKADNHDEEAAASAVIAPPTTKEEANVNNSSSVEAVSPPASEVKDSVKDEDEPKTNETPAAGCLDIPIVVVQNVEQKGQPPTVLIQPQQIEDGMASSTASLRSILSGNSSKTAVMGLPPAPSPLPSTSSAIGIGGSGPLSRATIAVSDVDGRAFDILLRYNDMNSLEPEMHEK